MAGARTSIGRSSAFPRRARLKRQRLIRPLFRRGESGAETLAVGCIRLLYCLAPAALTGVHTPVQAGFAVGRRKSAVRRNALRRRLRETYRTHQYVLRERGVPSEKTLILMVLLRGEGPYPRLRLDLAHALERLAARLET